MSQRVPEPSGPIAPIAAIDLHEQPLQRGFPKWDWRSLPFVLMHAGAVVLPFFTTFSWKLVALAIGLYLVRMFALTGFYHRYFSHRSFKTSRAFQFVMAVAGLTCVQKGPLWWAANHRHHHKHSDQHGDVHSPGLQGFIWAHMGWIMGDDWHETNLEGVPDLVKYPELRWLDTYHLVPGEELILGAHMLEVSPSLTTIRVPRYRTGQMLMEALVRVISAQGDYEETHLVDLEIVVRDSCGARLTGKTSGDFTQNLLTEGKEQTIC